MVRLLMRHYDYVFYRTCVAYKKRWPRDYWVHGLMVVTLVQGLSVVGIWAIVDEITGRQHFGSARTFLTILGAVLIALNYWRYDRFRTYEMLQEIWKDEPAPIRKKRGWLVISYVLALVFLPVLYGLVKHNLIGGKGFTG